LNSQAIPRRIRARAPIEREVRVAALFHLEIHAEMIKLELKLLRSTRLDRNSHAGTAFSYPFLNSNFMAEGTHRQGEKRGGHFRIRAGVAG
jgi:hypothetical protein